MNDSQALVPVAHEPPAPVAPQELVPQRQQDPDYAPTRTGKVARLPKKVRDQLNQMMLDGVPYLQIIERLGPAGEGLTELNLTTWKKGGFRDFQRHLHITEAIQAKYELAQSIIERSEQSNASGRAVLHVIATNLCEFLAEADPATLRESLLSDSDKFTRFVNSMVRLAEGGIKCELQKFRSEDRAAQTAKAKTRAEKPGISDESLSLAEEKLNLL